MSLLLRILIIAGALVLLGLGLHGAETALGGAVDDRVSHVQPVRASPA